MLRFLKNKVLLYTISRYFTYGIQFVGSLLIANHLGTYYLGIWGFIMLIIQYATRVNLGISNATNAMVAIHKTEVVYSQRIIGVAISMLLLLSILIALFFGGIYLFEIDFGLKYSFMQYAPYVVIITIISHFNLFFANVFRVYGKLGSIAFSQSTIPVALIVVALLYKGEQLVWALVWAYIFAMVSSFIFFILSSPISLKPIFDKKIFKSIQSKGWYLFIYNASFYLIFLSTRGFVSDYYSVDEFGYFTFAFTLANAILLLFDSLSFLIFPKVLNRFANQSNEQALLLLNMLRSNYITICHLSMHLGILFYPLLLVFFPQYKSTHKVFVMIALTVLVYTNGFGYPDLMIAKLKEKQMALISFLAFLLTILLNSIMIAKLELTIEFVMFPTLFIYMFFVFCSAKIGRKLIGEKSDFLTVFYDVFNIKWMLPFLLSIVITVFIKDVAFWYVLPLLLFIGLNYKTVISLYATIKRILLNPNVIDI